MARGLAHHMSLSGQELDTLSRSPGSAKEAGAKIALRWLAGPLARLPKTQLSTSITVRQ